MNFFGIGLDYSFIDFTQHPQAFIIKFAFPIIFYAFHGYAATWLAVRMLFRPYQAHYWPFTKIQIPLTPGIFPKRQSKLAQAVATTITDTLLTPADIKARAEELVNEENIFKSVDLFVDNVFLKEFRDTTKLHRLANDIATLSPTLLRQFVDSTITSLEQGKDTKIASITEKIFEQILMGSRITFDQANEIAQRIMENFLTPEKIRNGLIILLSPQNINALEESINVHASGPYRILARIIGVKRVCTEWRTFLEKEPNEALKMIGDLTKRFGIKHQIAIQIANFDLRAMPIDNIASLKKNVVKFVETFLVEHKADILEACRKLEDEAMATVRNAVLRFNPETIPPEWLLNVKRNIASFAYSYLKRELGTMVEHAIPSLGVHALIARKIDLFAPQQLEMLVYRICQNELHALELFGLVIGAAMGTIQIILNGFTYLH
ncbi:MAG: DUF445 family protein [Candidatus Melainabacteria bacterium]|mgnify:CR=1 FL=1|nr:DUF445 family protein [Candidatus Melainabacteria bacterium]